MKNVYIALAHKDDSGEYFVRVPDINGCITTGKDLQDAYNNAVDALSGCLCVLEDVGEPIPEPSTPEQLNTEHEYIMFVNVDTIRYRIETDNKAVRKSVSMPSWMAALAERNSLNLSQLLQKAVKAELSL